MKVIVTGATGFVGSEVVRKCIDRAEITSVIALGRRAIDQELSKNEKVQVVINENMGTYPQEVLDQLKGAEACISYGESHSTHIEAYFLGLSEVRLETFQTLLLQRRCTPTIWQQLKHSRQTTSATGRSFASCSVAVWVPKRMLLSRYGLWRTPG